MEGLAAPSELCRAGRPPHIVTPAELSKTRVSCRIWQTAQAVIHCRVSQLYRL